MSENLFVNKFFFEGSRQYKSTSNSVKVNEKVKNIDGMLLMNELAIENE